MVAPMGSLAEKLNIASCRPRPLGANSARRNLFNVDPDEVSRKTEENMNELHQYNKTLLKVRYNIDPKQLENPVENSAPAPKQINNHNSDCKTETTPYERLSGIKGCYRIRKANIKNSNVPKPSSQQKNNNNDDNKKNNNTNIVVSHNIEADKDSKQQQQQKD
ncbi:maker187 [Drosophila busckii]|uniref:Maker187 n=2 Tax=Drosophila busckii TaxID=30019 RepID=A0A0M4EI00_DROBS|nr:maker187 [Drosophila busckii]